MLLLVIKTFELLINQKKTYFLTYAVYESQGQCGQNIKL